MVYNAFPYASGSSDWRWRFFEILLRPIPPTVPGFYFIFAVVQSEMAVRSHARARSSLFTFPYLGALLALRWAGVGLVLCV
jgi:hypothetical protein